MHRHDASRKVDGFGIDDAIAALVDQLDLRECRYESFPFDMHLPRLEPGAVVLPAAEPGVAPWRAGTGVELPVRANGLTLGRFVLLPQTDTCGIAFTPTERAHALAIAAQVAPVVLAAWHTGIRP